ncbi:MAG: 50S ribosomal protein L25, partial [Flavobacteriaceae bacterium]|nr:50S ribosomal protein L25 [Flavobacteriaceae bacterium]
TAPGVVAGGNMRFPNRKLKVKALPANLPDFINADISELKIGDKLFVTELQNDKYTILHPDNTVVVQVRVSRLAVEEEEEGTEGEEGAEGAAPAAE